MHDDTQLETLIDRALSSYCDAPPSRGLEQRVLNRIRATEPAPRRFTALRSALALAIPALALVALVVRFQPEKTRGLTEAPLAKRLTVNTPQADAAAVRPQFFHRLVTNGRPSRRVAAPKALPKQEQFPAVAPLSDEERLLLAFVRRDPNQAARAFADLEKRTGDPLEIEAVEIKPLASDGAH